MRMKPKERREWILNWLKMNHAGGHKPPEANIANFTFVGTYYDRTGAADSCLSVDLRALHADGKLLRHSIPSNMNEFAGYKWVRSYYLPNPRVD